MANDACPHCRAGREYPITTAELGAEQVYWKCGSAAFPGNEHLDRRSWSCKQLATVTAERDEERENSRILRASRDEETAIADSWMRKCNELEQQLDELRRRLAEAPVGKIIGFHDGCILDIELDEGERVALFDRVRIVRDDQPEEKA